MATAVLAESDPRFKESPGEEIIVEVWNDKTRPWVFPPTKFSAPMRPRWVQANMTSSGRLPHTSIAKMPDLPGYRIGVNVKRRTCRYFDPLATTSTGRKLWTQAKSIIDAAKNFLPNCQIEKEQHFYFDCTDTELKTWLHWLRRGIDTGLVKLVEGSARMPSAAEIAAMPGKTEVNQLNNMTHKRRYLEDDEDYQPPKEMPGRREMVGAGVSQPESNAPADVNTPVSETAAGEGNHDGPQGGGRRRGGNPNGGNS